MDIEALRAGAERAAREAGALIMSAFGRVRVEHKGEVDLVTDADRASEALLVRRLSELLPEASILAEEGSSVERSPHLRWIVDPLDGTTNFAHGYPVFCVSIALEIQGRVDLGVIYDPTRDECFAAVRGRGAALGARPLRVSGCPDLGDALLITGFPYDVRTSARDNLAQFAAFVKRARAVRRSGSAAIDLATVAAGRADGFWEEGLQAWDVAAGALLVEEAGGRVSGYLGEPFDVDARNIVASNGGMHAAMIEVLTAIEDGGSLPPLVSRRRDSSSPPA